MKLDQSFRNYQLLNISAEFQVKSKKHFGKNIFFYTLVIFLLLLIFFLTYSILLKTVLASKTLPNLTLDGKNLSMLSKEELDLHLNEYLKKYEEEIIVVKFEEKVENFSLKHLSPAISTLELINTPDKFNPVEEIRKLFKILKPEEYKVTFDIDTKKIIEKFVKLDTESFSLEKSSGKLFCNGVYKDNIKEEKILEKFNKNLDVSNQLNISAEDIFLTQSETLVYQNCEKLLGTQLKLKERFELLGYDEETFLLTSDINGNIELDEKLADEILLDLKNKTEIKPVGSLAEVVNQRVHLLKNAENGRTLNIFKTKENINEWIKDSEKGLDLEYEILTAEKNYDTKLPVLDFTYKIGEGNTRIDLVRDGVANYAVPYTTYGLLEVQDLVVEPKTEFSYINTIKPQPNGYTLAGRPIQSGICNSTTTIFRAVLEAGFQITDRAPHYKNVNSYSYGYPLNIVDSAYYTDPAVDLKFFNDLDYPILLKFVTSKDKDYQYNKIEIYTSNNAPKREVVLDNWRIWDMGSPTVFKGSFDRKVMENGNLLRKETFESRYF